MRVCCIRDMAASVGQKKEICSDGFWTVTSQHWRDFLANCRFWVLRVSPNDWILGLKKYCLFCGDLSCCNSAILMMHSESNRFCVCPFSLFL